MFQVPLQTAGQPDPGGKAVGDLWEGEPQVQQRGSREETQQKQMQHYEDNFPKPFVVLKLTQLLKCNSYRIIAQQLCASMQSIAALVRVSEGDLRKAITFLQGAARLSVDKEITERTIIEIAGVRPRDGEPALRK